MGLVCGFPPAPSSPLAGTVVRMDATMTAYAEHAAGERMAEPSRDTDFCPYCRQYVPIVTHDCPSPEFPARFRRPD